ncbi:hypothetical protein AB0E69_21350 [Kribbella sp. NPDC026611]|uniref:hypothetical protein n=1 Tax=Kribbella sp. NPDC026611 TaxID=3154911 RepID=UPI00340D903D
MEPEVEVVSPEVGEMQGLLVAARPMTRQAADKAMTGALRAGELARASEYAEVHARHVTRDREQYVSIPKLQHDIAQFEYLQDQHVDIPDRTIDAYRQVLDAAQKERATTDRWLITDQEYDRIGAVYNQIVHRPDTPRVPTALSPTWDPRQVEQEYLDNGPGFAVIDGFLTDDALAGLRRFCLESTIWFNNRYAYGRLGSVFSRGFNCPLLVQLGEEIAQAFPGIIGPQHHLRQLWGYKNGASQPATPPHADFAAVNLNIWLTPDSANQDPATGGLDIFDLKAPKDWEFDKYNKDGRAIRQYLRESKATRTEIPYRANRALLFNSDLFHATQPLTFEDGYVNRRINVTFLFGKRTDE